MLSWKMKEHLYNVHDFGLARSMLLIMTLVIIALAICIPISVGVSNFDGWLWTLEAATIAAGLILGLSVIFDLFSYD